MPSCSLGVGLPSTAPLKAVLTYLSATSIEIVPSAPELMTACIAKSYDGVDVNSNQPICGMFALSLLVQSQIDLSTAEGPTGGTLSGASLDEPGLAE